MRWFVSSILTIVLFWYIEPAFSQDSRNGYKLSPHGEIRVLLIFMEIDYQENPQLDKTSYDSQLKWKKGQLPTWKDEVFEPFATNNPKAKITSYFHDASLGGYHVVGDYIDSIFTISDSGGTPSIGRILGRLKKQLNGMPFQTKNGLEADSFDLWENNEAPGWPKVNRPDSIKSFDHVMILMRNYHAFGNSGGYTSSGSFGKLWSYKTDSYSNFNAMIDFPDGIITHEFGHQLYGGNNFHTVGAGAGGWQFIFRTGGYSGMASAGKMHTTVNAWDRRRLGWKPKGANYDIRSYSSSGTEINTDISSASDLQPDGIYVLRDFISTGDAIRIKLPYLNVSEENKYVKQQWLWLENRQNNSGSSYDLNSKAAKGVYAYIQVGKEHMTSFSGPGNYLHFLPALGSYDLNYYLKDVMDFDTIEIDNQRNNPFTGYHHLMQPAINKDEDDVIKRVPKNEVIYPHKLKIDGRILTDQEMISRDKVTWGTIYDAFRDSVGFDKIGIGYNPAAVPVQTYQSPQYNKVLKQRTKKDNGTIHLNGISVQIMEQLPDGALKIKIRFDDYDVVNSLRWCGNIELHEEVRIMSGVTLTIDQGYSPQRPNNPQIIRGEKVFADSTVFKMNPGSKFTLEENSTLIIQTGSTFIVDEGIFEAKANAKIIVRDGGRLIVKKGAQFLLNPKADLKVQGKGKFQNNSEIRNNGG